MNSMRIISHNGPADNRINGQPEGRSVAQNQYKAKIDGRNQTKEAGEEAKRGRNAQSGRKSAKAESSDDQKTLTVDRKTEKPPQTQSA
jgi:hypothetical protein